MQSDAQDLADFGFHAFRFHDVTLFDGQFGEFLHGRRDLQFADLGEGLHGLKGIQRLPFVVEGGIYGTAGIRLVL